MEKVDCSRETDVDVVNSEEESSEYSDEKNSELSDVNLETGSIPGEELTQPRKKYVGVLEVHNTLTKNTVTATHSFY